MLQVAGLDVHMYGSHRFRAGRAVDLSSMGVDIGTISKIGHWSSNAVYKYLAYDF